MTTTMTTNEMVKGTAGGEAGVEHVVRNQAPQEVKDAYERFNRQSRENYAMIQEICQSTSMPIGMVQWIHIDNVRANDYNPNAVASHEMKLLHTSISEDGYTQPTVAMWDPEAELYIIVDGYHRYTTMRRYQDIYDSTWGYLPVVVLDKPIADRIASTVRHNRARGAHSVQGMGSLVFQMLQEGESDTAICNKLGLEAEELARLKHVTGFSKLFKDHEYSRTVTIKTQAEAKAAYAKEHPDEILPEGV